jgi:Zn-dependent peptidase ImmA (M78 family)
MNIFNLVKRLETLHNVCIRSVICNKVLGHCSYDWATDTIEINYKDKSPEEIIFSTLHEFRHALQMRGDMFPEIKYLTYDSFPNDETYFDLPWEKDANEWALRVGVEMGLLPEGWIPWYLKYPEAIRGWKEMINQ